MSGKTNIAWSDRVWNPTTGCSVVSPGCINCYAETLSLRRGWSKKPWTSQNAAENVVLHPDRLEDPLHWRKPQRIFVNSMSDLFHERIPETFIMDVFTVMQRAHWHTFQVLTKRPERMRDVLCASKGKRLPIAALPNVQLGVSVEDQRRADERIDILMQVPAAAWWISAEPLLGPLDLGPWIRFDGFQYREALSWVVVGGESGPGRRDMNVDWALDIAAQCQQYGVPLFMKQDSHARPGMQGRLPDSLWSRKEFPR